MGKLILAEWRPPAEEKPPGVLTSMSGYFPDFVLPGYSGHIPKPFRASGAKGATSTVCVKITNEKLPGRPKKAKAKKEKPIDMTGYGPSAKDLKMAEDIAAVKMRATAEAKKIFATTTVKVAGKGPAELSSMAELEREYNGNASKIFNQLPLMFPPPHYRNAPTHRSIERHRDLPRPATKMSNERNFHEGNVDTVTHFYQSMTEKRITQARAAAEEFDLKQKEMLKAKGLLSERSTKSTSRMPRPARMSGTGWNLKQPTLYRGHCVLLMPEFSRSESAMY